MYKQNKRRDGFLASVRIGVNNHKPQKYQTKVPWHFSCFEWRMEDVAFQSHDQAEDGGFLSAVEYDQFREDCALLQRAHSASRCADDYLRSIEEFLLRVLERTSAYGVDIHFLHRIFSEFSTVDVCWELFCDGSVGAAQLVVAMSAFDDSFCRILSSHDFFGRAIDLATSCRSPVLFKTYLKVLINAPLLHAAWEPSFGDFVTHQRQLKELMELYGIPSRLRVKVFYGVLYYMDPPSSAWACEVFAYFEKIVDIYSLEMVIKATYLALKMGEVFQSASIFSKMWEVLCRNEMAMDFPGLISELFRVTKLVFEEFSLDADFQKRILGSMTSFDLYQCLTSENPLLASSLIDLMASIHSDLLPEFMTGILSTAERPYAQLRDVLRIILLNIQKEDRIRLASMSLVCRFLKEETIDPDDDEMQVILSRLIDFLSSDDADVVECSLRAMSSIFFRSKYFSRREGLIELISQNAEILEEIALEYPVLEPAVQRVIDAVEMANEQSQMNDNKTVCRHF